jgi:hypothetical protein
VAEQVLNDPESAAPSSNSLKPGKLVLHALHHHHRHEQVSGRTRVRCVGQAVESIPGPRTIRHVCQWAPTDGERVHVLGVWAGVHTASQPPWQSPTRFTRPPRNCTASSNTATYPSMDQSAVSSVAGNQSMAKSRSNPPSRSVINWLWSLVTSVVDDRRGGHRSSERIRSHQRWSTPVL